VEISIPIASWGTRPGFRRRIRVQSSPVTTTKVETGFDDESRRLHPKQAARTAGKPGRFAIATARPRSFLLGASQIVAAGPKSRSVRPPNNTEYFQYGVGLASGRKLASGGGRLPDERPRRPASSAAVAGSPSVWVYRSARPLGTPAVAYEFTRMDSSKPAAARHPSAGCAPEARYYLDGGEIASLPTEPWASARHSTAMSGTSARSVPTLSAGLGASNFQVTQSTVIGAAIAYRGLLLHSWADSTHQEAGGSLPRLRARPTLSAFEPDPRICAIPFGALVRARGGNFTFTPPPV